MLLQQVSEDLAYAEVIKSTARSELRYASLVSGFQRL
jgi:hypothetical protein